MIFTNTKIALQYVHSNSFYYIKKELRRGILIFADFDPIGYALSCCGSLYLGLWLFVQIHSRTLYCELVVHFPEYVIHTIYIPKY